jgi:hypothetical protein
MFEGEVAHRVLERLRLTRLLRRFPPRLVWATFVFVNGSIAVGILAARAMISHTSFVFPSFGPTAFLLFFRPVETALTIMKIHAAVSTALPINRQFAAAACETGSRCTSSPHVSPQTP